MCELKKDNLKEALNDIEYFLLDMDGTVYLENELIGKMDETLDFLRSKGKKIIYLTNNSSRSISEYVKKLTKMNLFREGDRVYSSGEATAEYLAEKHKGKSVYLLGTKALKEEFLNHEINLIEEGQPDIAVLAYDTELTYEKLCKFIRAVKKGAYYIATHPDVNCPAKDVYVPDAGSFIKLVEESTGLTPVEIIGKPYSIMGLNLQCSLNARQNQFVMVGDRLHTDIKFGVNCGFYTLLVFSGETTLSMLNESDVKPSFTLDSLNDIIKCF